MCHIMGLNVLVLTSSRINFTSGMCTDFMCSILGLNEVVLTSSSRNVVSVICNDLTVYDTGPQGSSTDL